LSAYSQTQQLCSSLATGIAILDLKAQTAPLLSPLAPSLTSPPFFFPGVDVL